MKNAALLRRLTSTLMSTPPEAPLSERLLRGFVSVSEADGGAITIGYSRTDRTMIAFTDPIAERVEELQDFLREGPGLDAFRTGHPVAADDASSMRAHWPLLSQSLAQDLPAVSAYPMKPYSEVLGVLTVHRRPDRPAPWRWRTPRSSSMRSPSPSSVASNARTATTWCGLHATGSTTRQGWWWPSWRFQRATPSRCCEPMPSLTTRR